MVKSFANGAGKENAFWCPGVICAPHLNVVVIEENADVRQLPNIEGGCFDIFRVSRDVHVHFGDD